LRQGGNRDAQEQVLMALPPNQIQLSASLESADGIPLVAWFRGDYLEAVHRGSFAVVNARGQTLRAHGDPLTPTLLRSCAKPFQLMTVLASGAAERFGFSDAELAVAAASHSGEEEHRAAVASMLSKTGLEEGDLRCGAHPPFAPHVAAAMARAGRTPSPLDNNCSGKHAAMLAACLVRGWRRDAYESPDHPLQIANRACTARFADCEPSLLGVAIDGCTVPTFGMPLSTAALSFARVADPAHAPAGDAEHAQRVFQVMNGHPTMGSGSVGRLEAALMALFPGQVIAKVGAEGLFIVGVAPGVLDTCGVGIAVKLGDGITFNRACDGIVVELLHRIGLLDERQLTALAPYHPTRVQNCRGETVGDVRYLLP
jgi:L-asparaginase II